MLQSYSHQTIFYELLHTSHVDSRPVLKDVANNSSAENKSHVVFTSTQMSAEANQFLFINIGSHDF